MAREKQGYRDALEQYRLPFEERLIKYGDYTFESGYRAIMELEREAPALPESWRPMIPCAGRH